MSNRIRSAIVSMTEMVSLMFLPYRTGIFENVEPQYPRQRAMSVRAPGACLAVCVVDRKFSPYADPQKQLTDPGVMI